MDAMDRWFSLEMNRLQQGLVRAPRHLGDLLAEDEPTAVTKNGEVYQFDRDALHRFGEGLPLLARHLLRVPVMFYADKESDDSAYLADPMAVEALAHHGLTPPGRVMRDGKYWIGLPLARDISNRFPTLFQFVLM